MSQPGPIPTEYTAIMTGEPFLHFELKIVAQMRLKGLSSSEIRELVKADNSFQHKTTKSIARVLKAVLRRLDVLDDRLVELCAHGNLSSSRIVTLFAIAKTNLLFFEFLEEVYREKCALGNTPLTAKDVRIFFTQKSQQSPLVANWSEGTIRKLRQVYLKTMIDSGLVIPDEPVSAPIIDEELYEHLKAIGEYRFLAALTGDVMATIEERLDQIYEIIQREEFMTHKGLGNEIGFYIFDYDPEDEMLVRAHIQALKNRLNTPSSKRRVVEFDLYSMFLSILEQEGLLSELGSLEDEYGPDYLLEAVRDLASPEVYVQLIEAAEEDYDLVFLTGVGRVWPIVRSHTVLNNLHHVLDRTPVIMFFPGRYDGTELRLFDRIKDDNYYRAFSLVPR